MHLPSTFSYAGLHSKIISGYAKGADYKPGQKFNPGQNQHSWNAVYIYGTWCLIDAHWAARRIVGKQATTEEYHYQLDEYFFLIDPQQHIFTHFPDDSKWQLLERPVCTHRSIKKKKWKNSLQNTETIFSYEMRCILESSDSHTICQLLSHLKVNLLVVKSFKSQSVGC